MRAREVQPERVATQLFADNETPFEARDNFVCSEDSQVDNELAR